MLRLTEWDWLTEIWGAVWIPGEALDAWGAVVSLAFSILRFCRFAVGSDRSFYFSGRRIAFEMADVRNIVEGWGLVYESPNY